MSEITQEQAQMEATQHQQMVSFASALARPNDGKNCSELIKGVVTAYTYPYMTVQIGGDTATSISQVRHWESYTPVVGDTCTMIKQGSDIVAVGRINTTTGAAALNGWTQPSLTSGFSHSSDPIMWRVVNDHGDQLLQLRGSATLSGVSYTANAATVFTLPVGSRPATNRSVLIPRDAGGLCIKLNILTTGVVQIDNLVGVLSGVTQHGNLTTSYYNVDHFHEQGGGGSTGTVRYSTGGAPIFGVLGGSFQDGGTDPTHRHTTDSATHTHAMANTVPSAMWLTGIAIILV